MANATPRVLIDAAYGTSKLNQPEISAAESGELLPLIQRKLGGYFAEGAQLNRKIFGAKATIAFATDGWLRPKPGAPSGCNGVEMITRIESGSGMTTIAQPGGLTVGTEIIEVPFDQRSIELGKPCVYAWGQKFYPVGPLSVSQLNNAGNMVFWYSTQPATITNLTTAIDPLWPGQFDSLLILDIAMYLSRKDGGERRAGELVAFAAEYEQEHARYLAWLEHESVTELRDFDHYNVRNSPAVKIG